MKLVVDSGLWTTGPRVQSPPAIAVLEIAGAVLAWTVADAAGADAMHITFTDIAAADWLWRLVGPDAHAHLALAVGAADVADGAVVDVSEVIVAPEPVAALRRLALGHWLRRWWPTSERDGVAALDAAVLDAEIALLTADLQEYFSHDTFDSDVAGLLAPHRAALTDAVRRGDPRVGELVRAAVSLVDEAGLGDWSEILDRHGDFAVMRRDDYSLAAGRTGSIDSDAMANGTSSVCWTAVPHTVFDAAEDTVDWSVRSSATGVVVRVQVATIGSADGVPLRFASGEITGHGVLDAGGGATLLLVDAAGVPVTETVAWAHHWAGTQVSVGAVAAEPQSVRAGIREWVQSRLSAPGPDSFLAEILAAEADY